MARREKPKATTRVTLGWVVKKSFTKQEVVEENGVRRLVPKRFDKIISKVFSSMEAAGVFLDTVKKYPINGVGEKDVEYYVTTLDGHDSIPDNLPGAA
jgi:hypothetical protein